MAVTYKKLWHILIDRDMKKKDLQEAANLTGYAIGKLTRDEAVTTDVLAKICRSLNCTVDDIMEVLPEDKQSPYYGTEFEIKLRNELTQKVIAKECAEWIRKKVVFKSNVSDKTIQGQMVVDNVGYTPIDGFTTVELGCEKGNSISTTIVKDESLAQTFLRDFNEIWNDSMRFAKKAIKVTGGQYKWTN